MIVSMDRIEMVFLKKHVEEMVPFLQELGVVHIEDVPLALDDHPGYLHRIHLPDATEESRQRLDELNVLLKEIHPLVSPLPQELAIRDAALEFDGNADLDTLRTEIREHHYLLRSLTRRWLNARDNLETVENYHRALSFIEPLLAHREVHLGRTGKALLIPRENAGVLDRLTRDLVRDVGPECSLVHKAIDRNSIVSLVCFPEGRVDAVTLLLKRHGIVPLEVPDRELRGLPLSEAVARSSEKIIRFGKDIESIQEERRAYSLQHGARIFALERALADLLNRLLVVDQFAQSEMIAVVHGWIPRERFDELARAVENRFGKAAVLGYLPKKDIEIRRVPTLLRNHPIFKPFQLLLGMFDPPTYGTIDPTWLVALSFVVFYGFILGDAGYGLFIIGVAALVKRKWHYKEMLCDAMTIAQWMGASSIVWGIVYGEFFGDLPERFFGIHPLFHRMHEPMILLGAAIAFGAVHIPAGLLLGALEGYRHGHTKHGHEKLGMLFGLVSLGVAVLGIAGAFPGGLVPAFVAAGALLSLSIVLLVLGMNGMFAMGLMEIIGLTSNVLSYARLMALGLASVVLADLANSLLGLPGLTGIVAGTILAGLVHLLNIGIGVFSPTIHSLRLNYVEFLPKFYEPEGRSYQPFRKELSW
jgi:V/A-type H+-transporting ATPase subunit I